MAGSRKWMIYVADDGTEYAVQIDESNAEALGFQDITADNVTTLPLPKGYKMRSVSVQDPVSGARRELPVGTAVASVTIAAAVGILLPLLNASGLATALTLFNTLYTSGERVARPRAFDTGLLDGDAT